MQTYTVKRLEQAKLLTDPFKLQLLEQFAGTPATTKQVADRMGEKAPRLYRHVDALVDEGLLELVEEKPKRGTIERYYRTVAARFEVDPNLFSPADESGGEAIEMIRSVFRDAESDLVRVFDALEGDEDEDSQPIVMKLAVRASQQEIAGLRRRLEDWLADCDTLQDQDADDRSLVTWDALLTFYPRPDPD